MTTALLSLRDVHAGYGSAHVLNGVSIDLAPGECLSIFGRNGVGKSTLMKAVIGQVKLFSGEISVAGCEIGNKRSDEIVRAGVGFVPQGRRIFPNLTVLENLQVAVRPGHWSIDRVHEMLPILRERSGNAGTQLSGGEQQMLAIARALVGNPQVLLLDEPSEGLAPLIVDRVGELIASLSSEGLGILLVEQNIGLGMRVADRVALMAGGRIAHELSTDDFYARSSLVRSVLGVGV